ncbi:hypothetical protein AKJ45_01370, partial [candidate division MSBL1 archaeon SCGC-AAA261F19]
MRVYCETYGCTMNRADTEFMLGQLQRAGHKVVKSLDDADIAIVNTCAVKGPTMRSVLHRLGELKHREEKKVIVGGCLPLINLEAVERKGPFEGIISCLSLNLITEVVERVSRGSSNVYAVDGTAKKIGAPRFRMNRISAPIPIAEGCLSNCSYCCVKSARKRLRSYGPEKIVAEIKNELKSGRREILLTSQDTAAYGWDGEIQLPQLLKKVTSINGKFRVRIGMMNPAFAKQLLPELVDAFDSEKIYKFLHLPVQSGDDEILRKMRRGYTIDEFLKIVKAFRERFSDLYLATDVIVGFPGESKEAFEKSCSLIEKVRPDKVNVTRFTPMPKTDAAKMKQLNGREKKTRSKKL